MRRRPARQRQDERQDKEKRRRETTPMDANGRWCKRVEGMIEGDGMLAN
jgi:hypothetical protein